MKASSSFTESRFASGLAVVPVCLLMMSYVLPSPAAAAPAKTSRYHSKGFEVVGISSDDDRQALEKFVKENRIPWPQYYDGKGELNQFALKFDLGGIPTMWLLDRKGVLRDLNAVNNLSRKIEKLLNE